MFSFKNTPLTDVFKKDFSTDHPANVTLICKWDRRMGKKEFLEDGDQECTGIISWDKLNEMGNVVWKMKEFERQICSLKVVRRNCGKMWFIMIFFFASCSLTTSFQKSDVCMQCQQGSLKEGQSLQKEHSNSKYLRYFAAVSLQVDLKQDTRRL